MSINYRHFRLKSGNILTIASYIAKHSNSIVVQYGCAVFDKRDKTFIKKFGNQLARNRIQLYETKTFISNDDEYTKIDHSLISLRIIDHMLSVLNDFKNHIEVYPCYFLQLCRSTTIENDLEYLKIQLKDKILLRTLNCLDND